MATSQRSRPARQPGGPDAASDGPSLADQVFATAERIKRGPGNWFDRLAPEVQAELVAMRQRFHAEQAERRITRTAFSKALCQALTDRGLVTIQWPEVEKWLLADR